MTTLMKEMRIAQLSAKISYTYFQACLPHWKYLLVENISFKYLATTILMTIVSLLLIVQPAFVDLNY